MTWDELLAALPLVAIVRGLRPDEAVGIGSAVYRPGQTPAEVRAQATAFVAAWRDSAPA